MRYLLFLIPVIIIIITLHGCKAASEADFYNGDNNRDNDGRIKIVSTIFPPYDFARNIAGGRADVSMLLPLSADVHTYEPSPRDIIKAREADVFLYIGGASDLWTESVFSGDSDNSDTITVRLMDTVSLLKEEHTHGDVFFDEYNEHIWTSPRNAILMTRAICEALAAADPANAEFYRQNAEDYIKVLNELDDTFREITDAAIRKTVIFADRFAFRYLTEEYGLEYFAAIPVCDDESEPSARTLMFLIEKIREEKIPVIFYGELSDMRTANSITRETDAAALLLHSCHSLSREKLEAGTGYAEIMRENAEALKTALN